MLDGLNPQQREVAQLRQHCVAIACPGAGKTKTIATKAAMLLQEDSALVGAVTFSKEAAIELRERILLVAGKTAQKRLIAGTFHSLAYKQLLRPGAKPARALKLGAAPADAWDTSGYTPQDRAFRSQGPVESQAHAPNESFFSSELVF